MLVMRASASQGVAGANPASAEASHAGSSPGGQPVDWIALVARIREGENNALEQLYQIFSRGIRFYLCRQLGPEELEDRVHDTFLIVVGAIRKGDLREPDRLMGFVRTIVRRQVATYIDVAIHSRRDKTDIDNGIVVVDGKRNPEQQAIDHQKMELMKAVLDGLGSRDREILVRFYLREEPQDQICREMSLTETQFRLLKSRAKARFGESGKKKLASAKLLSIFMKP